jgi:hypothetical protein
MSSEARRTSSEGRPDFTAETAESAERMIAERQRRGENRGGRESRERRLIEFDYEIL